MSEPAHPVKPTFPLPVATSDSLAATQKRSSRFVLEEGELFGRYKILEKLGGGGMGCVYLALDLQLDRTVALKIPRLYGNSAEKRLQRFQREAKAAAAISHENICPVHDVGQIDGVNYLSMEHIDGASLTSLIKSGKRFSHRQVASLIRRLAKAMGVAHRAGVFHRDLKPSNIVVDKQGRPVIVDFGLAFREEAGDPKVTKEGTAIGTPAYMSPEHITDGMEAAGAASDIYSLGVMMYSLLTLRLPFSGKVPAVYVRIVNEEPRPPRDRDPSIPAELEQICLTAMAKKPSDRFASMDDFAQALGHYLTNDHPEPASSRETVAELTGDNPFTAASLETHRELFTADEIATVKLPRVIDEKTSPGWSTSRTVITVLLGLSLGGIAAWYAKSPELVKPQPGTDSQRAGESTTELAPSVPDDPPLTDSKNATAHLTEVIPPSPEVKAVTPEVVGTPLETDPVEGTDTEVSPAEKVPAPEEVVNPDPVKPRTPEEVLAAAGLVKLTRSYALTQEGQFADKLRELQNLDGQVRIARQELLAVEQKENLREQQIHDAQKEWHSLETLQERAQRTNDARRYNQVVAKRNELATTIKRLQSEKDTRLLDVARERLADNISQHQVCLFQTKTLGSEIQATYTRLLEDTDIEQAIGLLNPSEQTPLPVEPSKQFLRSLSELEKLEEDTVRWEIPTRRDGDKTLISVQLNDSLSVDMEYGPASKWTLIPLALAGRLGLRPTATDPKVSITLPDGGVHEGTKMRLESVQVGPATVRDVECIVLPEAFNESRAKLGMTFTRFFVVQLQGEALVLQPLDSSTAAIKTMTKSGSKR